MNSHKCDGMS